MNLLDLAQSRVPMRQVSGEWHGPCPSCGTSHADPRLSDRFSVKPDKGLWFCRTCRPQGGDAVAFLREFEGKSCPEAHALLGKACESTSCPVLDKCSQGKRGAAPMRKPLEVPKPAKAAEFVPAAASSPAELWRQAAEKLVDRANAALLESPEQLAYLAGRALPRGAVERYRLGWLAEDLYRPRAAWGLEEIRRDDGKPKKLWLPSGIVIPFFDAEGNPERIRIRRSMIKEGEARYYWVPGSGDDVPVLGVEARAFALVESDLDALLVHWHAGDLVGAIPLGTCSAKPKATAMAALERALGILVSLDFEPRENERTGRHENPGGKSAQWWLKQFPRARRWPVPAGKDPGEFFQEHGGDIRAWILAGLPAVFRVTASQAKVESPVGTPAPAQSAPAQVEKEEAPESSAPAADHGVSGYLQGVSQGGIPYVIAENSEILAGLRESRPDHAPFLREEMRHLKGLSPEEAHFSLLAKRIFPELDTRILGTRPIVGSGCHNNVVRFDPSRSREARRKGERE